MSKAVEVVETITILGHEVNRVLAREIWEELDKLFGSQLNCVTEGGEFPVRPLPWEQPNPITFHSTVTPLPEMPYTTCEANIQVDEILNWNLKKAYKKAGIA